MQYALTIYGGPREMTQEEGQAMSEAYLKVTEEMRATAHSWPARGCSPIATATTVRVPTASAS